MRLTHPDTPLLPSRWGWGLLLGLALMVASCKPVPVTPLPTSTPPMDETAAIALVEEAQQLSLIWEAWSTLEQAYKNQDGLDKMRAVEGAIIAMLDLAEEHPYPFLTKLDYVTIPPPQEVPTGLEDIWRTWLLIRSNDLSVSIDAAVHVAARGLTLGLDDPHAGFYTKEEYVRTREDQQGEYEGIGAYVQMIDERITITQPISGGPAEKADIQPGDVITAVNGQSIEGLTIEEAVELIRGPEGTEVTLTIQRRDREAPLTISVSRGKVDVPSVASRRLPLDVYYLYLREFNNHTGDELREALQEALDSGARGFVLDLRNNPGGTVTAAIDVASQFLDQGLVMYEVNPEGDRTDRMVKPGGLATDLPLAVVVNRFSASAAEVVSGALQDHGRALLFGEGTYGKGAVQIYKVLSDGSAMRVTTSLWHTPSGHQLNGQGLVPDEVVQFDGPQRILQRLGDGTVLALDTQLQAAYEHVLSLLGKSLEDVPLEPLGQS